MRLAHDFAGRCNCTDNNPFRRLAVERFSNLELHNRLAG